MKNTFDATTFELTPTDKGYTAAIGDEAIDVELLSAGNGKLDLLLDGQRVTAYVTADGAKRWVTVQGRTYLLTKQSSYRPRLGGPEGASGLAAPMPGQVRSVGVAEGDHVQKGQTLVVVEAMKMEIRVQAPRDALVKKLFVRQGDTVERGQILVDLGE
jgi:biotin carboxyl carrier protein